MNRSRSQLTSVAAQLAVIAGMLGVVAGVVQATIGNRIPAWTGHKHSHVALGLLTVALGASILISARTLHGATMPGPETLTAIALWLAAVAVLCATTVGRLWVVPGALAFAAASVTLAACGWQNFRSFVGTHWFRGLLGLLGFLDVLMAVSAASATVVVAGLVAGAVLIAAAILSRPGPRPMVILAAVATFPYVALTWWTIVTPLLTVVALAVGLAATGRNIRPPRRWDRCTTRPASGSVT